MIQVLGRNLALAAGKLMIISVVIFLILQTSEYLDVNLSFAEFFQAIFSGRLMQNTAQTGIPDLKLAFLYSATTLVLALILSYGFGGALGILLGRYRMAWTQILGHVFVSIALAIPAFWVSYIILYYTIRDWGIFIGGEIQLEAGADWFSSFIGKCLLLAIPLSLSGMAFVSRQVSQTLLHAFPERSLTSSRSLGITQRMIFDTVFSAVIWRPVLRSFPFLLSLFLSVLIVTETAFFVPGFGYAVYKAASTPDLQSLAVLSLWVTIMLIIANLIVDIIIEMIDNRQHAAPETE